MKQEIRYIERINGFNHNGIAWVGLVSYSKSGKTIYFDGKAFQSSGSDRNPGNYYDIKTGEAYWISGVKKNMQDRHKFGNGIIYVEKRVLKEYLKIVGRDELPKSKYELITIKDEYPIERINLIENEKLEKSKFNDSLYFKNPREMNNDELEYLINELIYDEKESKFNKSRRSIKKKRIELENELESRT